MFGKLCKYEFKSIVRTLVPIYLAVIAVSILNAFVGFGSLFSGYLDDLGFVSNLLGLIQGISIFVYFGVMVALSVLTLIVIIQRFYKGLLCDEGYLMFTLPVKPWQLIAAKGTAAFVMSLASGLTAIISIVILILGSVGPADFFEAITSPYIWDSIGRVLSEAPSWPLLLLELILAVIISGMGQLYHMYFSMALGHLSSSHRIMMSVVAYIAISMAFSFISGFLVIIASVIPVTNSFFTLIDTMATAESMIYIFHTSFIFSIVFGAIQLAVFFFGTERILSKRLNLE
ncbi:MAG: hypothetical protein QM657_12900 [Lacrimispora sp.]|uniref:hypothetical protein n=1 Tax=Lacrimispora sp. TaxID=2719234 RepID=UPI0039E4CA0F